MLPSKFCYLKVKVLYHRIKTSVKSKCNSKDKNNLIFNVTID